MLGAIIGDVVGSRYEFNNIKIKDFELVGKGCYFTDDTVMSIAVDEIMINGWQNDRDRIIQTLKKWGQKYPHAGYGSKFRYWVLSNDPRPYYSCGNGSAMRVSAAGWFANSEAEAKQNARAVTEVTHNHPEGLKGAYVTALCIYYARNGYTKEQIKAYVEKYYKLDFTYEELVKTYEHGPEICQETVPQAVWCFLNSDSFEDCLRTTISIGGDCDTTAAISCAIAEAYYGLDESIARLVLPYLSKDIIEILKKIPLYNDLLK